MRKQKILDWLYRLHLYWGVRMNPPDDLVKCEIDYGGATSERYILTVDDDNEIGYWLLNDCDGPWSIGLYRPLHKRKAYISFARVADAVIFRFKTAD